MNIVDTIAAAHIDPLPFARALMEKVEGMPYQDREYRNAILRQARDAMPLRYRIPAVRMQAVDVTADTKISAEWGIGSTHWRCTFTRGRRRMSVSYHMGSAHKGAPDMWDVLSCLFSDAESAGESFESWASDMGYDADSRKAEATYKACQSIAKRLAALFGDNLDVWRELSRDV